MALEKEKVPIITDNSNNKDNLGNFIKIVFKINNNSQNGGRHRSAPYEDEPDEEEPDEDDEEEPPRKKGPPCINRGSKTTGPRTKVGGKQIQQQKGNRPLYYDQYENCHDHQCSSLTLNYMEVCFQCFKSHAECRLCGNKAAPVKKYNIENPKTHFKNYWGMHYM